MHRLRRRLWLPCLRQNLRRWRYRRKSAFPSDDRNSTGRAPFVVSSMRTASPVDPATCWLATGCFGHLEFVRCNTAALRQAVAEKTAALAGCFGRDSDPARLLCLEFLRAQLPRAERRLLGDRRLIHAGLSLSHGRVYAASARSHGHLLRHRLIGRVLELRLGNTGPRLRHRLSLQLRRKRHLPCACFILRTCGHLWRSCSI